MMYIFRLSYLIRLLIIGAMGYALVTLVPVLHIEYTPILSNPLYGLILFIFISGFLINQTMDRNRTLQVGIELELSRTRRIMHVVENMGVSEVWKKGVKNDVLAYLQSIASHDFLTYSNSDKLFRVMTHQIYSCLPKTRKDEVFFSELLFITREIAFERQELSHSLNSPMAPYVWIVYFFIASISIALLLIVRDTSILSTAYAFLVSITVLLISDLLIELSVITKSKRKQFQNLYAENVRRITKE